MKITLLRGTLAFALAVPLMAACAHAQNVPALQGDLILSFQATSGQNSGINLEVDLGQLSNFLPGGTDATGAPVNLTQLFVADIASEYGSNWNSLTTLEWSVAGTNYRKTTYSGVPQYTLFGTEGFGAPIPVGDAPGSAVGESGNINTMVTGLSSEPSISGSDTLASFVPTTDPNSFNSNSGGASPFFTYNGFGQSFESNTDGTTFLDLFEIKPGLTGIDLGDFSLSSGGLIFQALAVPEPPTWASIVLGAAALIGLRRRRA